MVHETRIIFAMSRGMEGKDSTYFRIEFIDSLNRPLHVSRMYGVSDINSLLYALGVTSKSDARLDREFLRCRGIPLVDQVVHDNEVNVPIKTNQFRCSVPTTKNPAKIDCVELKGIRNTIICCSPHSVSERFPTV